MKIKTSFLGLILIFSFFFISYRLTFSFFNDVSHSTNNIFSAASSFPSPTPSPSPLLTSLPIANHLVINEVLYDTNNDQNIGGPGGSNRGEFVEIYNPTASPINVNGWIIDDGTETETLPSISVPAGGFLIITGATEAEFEAIWTVPTSVVYYSATGGKICNGFSNSGGLFKLKSDSTTIVDQISFGGDTSVLNPAPPDVATGHSLERDPDGLDSDSASDFFDRTTPTPGM